MNIRIVLGTGLLLAVGTAVAGTLVYGQGKPALAPDARPAVTPATTSAVSPETIAYWRASSASDGYIAPKVPI